MSETVGDRVRDIREARGEKQPEFAKTLTSAAKKLKIAVAYDNTMVSKMEVGRRDVDLNDVLVISSVDPEKRGREWLAWGDVGSILLDPKRDRGLTPDEEKRALTKAAEVAKQQKGKGGRREA